MELYVVKEGRQMCCMFKIIHHLILGGRRLFFSHSAWCICGSARTLVAVFSRFSEFPFIDMIHRQIEGPVAAHMSGSSASLLTLNMNQNFGTAFHNLLVLSRVLCS